MKKFIVLLLISTSLLFTNTVIAQPNEQQLGAWYMYFVNGTFKESAWGMQGDLQYRNWNIAGDLEQLLVRGGLTFQPQKSIVKFTLGYANISTGVYGKDKTISQENRIYQEALFPVQLGSRIYTNHRFRYEQRFVEGQDFRTRYRYNLFVNIPLNHQTIVDKTVYLAFYNELFINGQRNIGNGNTVEIFDRNRLYIALGYAVKQNLKLQLGFMRQQTDSWGKNQLQLSFHHKI